MSRVRLKLPNWGSGFGSPALLIFADSPLSVTSRPNGLMRALVPQQKDEKLCLVGGGVPFPKKIGYGIVHFGRGA